jgi:anthranilate synthase component I
MANTVTDMSILVSMEAAKAEGYTLYPVWREVLADCETPVSAFRKLAHGPYTFLLESVEGGERLARYSFVGIAPERALRVRGDIAEWRYLQGDHVGRIEQVACSDPLALVQEEVTRERVAPVTVPGWTGTTLPRFIGGAIGYLGYEMVTRFERVPLAERDPLGVPETLLIFTDTLLIFDHVAHRARIVTHVHLEDDLEEALIAAEERLDNIERGLDERLPSRVNAGVRPTLESVDMEAERANFEQNVQKAQEAIIAGDAFQIVLSRRVARPTQADAFTIYRALRALNPSPYLFYLDCEDFAVAGASPEMLVRVEGGEIALHPIAGTRPRGVTNGADAAYEAELRYDPKEQAEHIMLVDLGRNDVGRIATPGSVRVTQMMDVERYSHVMHLVSHITGSLKPGLTAFDAVRAAFPAGTLTGAPKVRAMEIIAELEGERRGIYGGGVGYFSRDGNLDMAIVIRTLVIKDGVAYAQSGAGVVADSTPEGEYNETERKAEALWRAIDLAESLVTPRPSRARKRK